MQLNKDTKAKLYLFLGVVLLLFAFWLVSTFKGHFAQDDVGVITAESGQEDSKRAGDLEYTGNEGADTDTSNGDEGGRLLRAVNKNTSTSTIIVHIVGAVKVPGVYELPASSRMVDALRAAKGFVANADREGVNLAEKISDGEKIVFPFVSRGGEENTYASATSSNGAKKSNGNCSDNSGGNTSNKGKRSSRSKGKGTAVVNINTASEEELTTIVGVGKVTAKLIIKYRETHGNFATIEELTNVKGIGAKKFQKMRDFVTVN